MQLEWKVPKSVRDLYGDYSSTILTRFDLVMMFIRLKLSYILLFSSARPFDLFEFVPTYHSIFSTTFKINPFAGAQSYTIFRLVNIKVVLLNDYLFYDDRRPSTRLYFTLEIVIVKAPTFSTYINTEVIS